MQGWARWAVVAQLLPQSFHSQGNVTDLCCPGDMRGTQTIPLAVVETTELLNLPLSESSCTCVQWEQFGVWFLCKAAVQGMMLLVQGVGGNNVKLNPP